MKKRVLFFLLFYLLIVSSCIATRPYIQKVAEDHKQYLISLEERLGRLETKFELLQKMISHSTPAQKENKIVNQEKMTEAQKQVYGMQPQEVRAPGYQIFVKKCYISCHDSLRREKNLIIQQDTFSEAGWFVFLQENQTHKNILDKKEKQLILKYLSGEEDY